MVGCFGLFSCLRTRCNSTHSWDNRFVIIVFSVHPKKNSKERVTSKCGNSKIWFILYRGGGRARGGRGPLPIHSHFSPKSLESQNNRRRVEISSSVLLQT